MKEEIEHSVVKPMQYIRKATTADASRLAEILVFTKRRNYRPIFQNDPVSFGEIQVLPIALAYLEHPQSLENIWVYDDAFVKGMIHIEGTQIEELYVDSFFASEGIGSRLMEFALREKQADRLWVLEKNDRAIRFYKRHGFVLTKERAYQEGTTEYIVKMVHGKAPNIFKEGSSL